jgi:SAM-dependent methyltransferase
MENSPTAVLQCPSCGNGLTELASDEARRHVGTVFACRGCGREMPCFAGVIVDSDSDLRAALLDAIRSGDEARATDLILERYGRRVRAMERLGMKVTFNRFVRHRILAALMERCRLRHVVQKLPTTPMTDKVVKASQFNLYIRHRFSAPSFLSTIPLLGLVLDTQGLILDAPCGMGHLSYKITRLVPEQRMVCMDLLPPFAYSARRFFVPNAAAAIVHDMNDPIPLKGGQFSAIFCSDAFHYVANKQELASEFMRLLRDDGVLAIPHLHNRLQYNPVPGIPLSPDEYAKLFEGFHVRLYPERHLVDAYLNDRPLDLSVRYSDDELNGADAMVLVASKSPNAFRVLPRMRQRLQEAASNPRVSGLYEMRRSNGHVVFRRKLTDSLKLEYPRFVEVLPEQVTIDATHMHQQGNRVRFEDAPELLRQHVLVDVPEEY